MRSNLARPEPAGEPPGRGSTRDPQPQLQRPRRAGQADDPAETLGQGAALDQSAVRAVEDVEDLDKQLRAAAPFAYAQPAVQTQVELGERRLVQRGHGG